MRSKFALTASGVIFDQPEHRLKLKELEARSASPDFWNDQQAAQAVLRQQTGLQANLDLAKELDETAEEIQLYRELIAEGDPLQDELTELLESYYSLIDETELQMMLSGDHDKCNAILSIHPGAGGTESQDWASMIYRMYMRYAEKQGFKVVVLDYQDGEEAGVKSVTLHIKGEYAYGYLKAESGVHRLVRISPYDAAKRRHTSFCSVHSTPEIEDEDEVQIEEKDLRVDTFRASGAGGQHVNTTDSAIRITHIPTGIVVQCQNERSQHKNKASAMKVLRSRLVEQQEEQRRLEMDATTADKKDIAWGSQIRSYVLHPYRMVKDHRTGEKTSNVDAVIDGSIQSFVRAYLLGKTAEEQAEDSV